MKVLLPTGIGDSVWALHKIQSVRDKLDPHGRIDVSLVGGTDKVDTRALDFVRRFRFVDSVDMRPYSLHAYGPLTHPDGTYNYIEDGRYTFDDEPYIVLIPNRSLEQGIRLEDWLPHYPIRWSIFDDFRLTITERVQAADIHRNIGRDFAVFYPGPLAGNTVEGHNRGPLWTPADWLQLGRLIHDQFGLDIVTVGASYDLAYYAQQLEPILGPDRSFWHNQIGQTTLGQLWALTSRSRFVISYQAGVGIVSTYLGTPTAIFWRPQGDSISSKCYLSFDNRMASAWVPPNILASGTHMPLYYNRCSPESVLAEVRQRRWHEAPARHAPASVG